ncbi:MAG: C69 family dipeptidase [Muribaculaceae bacterium]|nr:C69 family dipeptidase [Muribaculaceae bacterium]
MKIGFFIGLAGAALVAADAFACTNFIVGKKASADGSVMVSYADDSYTRFGYLHHSPRGKHQPGEMRKVVDWGDDSPRGEIPQAAETYNVVGNMNEHQLVIGETTWGGYPELEDTTGNSILDYGSLIYITLERCKNAREAIKTMGELVDKYGYASTGETFSIADKNEAWIMEMIGKGSGEKGANWIAVRIPDNAIAAHANEPRIRKVDYKDKENVMYSKDLFKWARKHGYLKGKDEDFSFADAFSDHKAAKRRSCDGRVWSFYRNFATPEEDAKWLKWVTAESDEPLPLYIIPDRKLSLKDMQDRMRDHYEGTPLDMTQDIGGGNNKAPVRWKPNKFEVDGESYFHERPTATQQTAWHFVSQSRSDMPDAVGGVLWFGTDDANTSVYMPFYCSMTEVPEQLQAGNGDLYNFSPTANFWVNNWVANQAYHRYDLMIDDIRKVQGSLEGKFADARKDKEQELLALYEAGDTAGLEKSVNEEGAAIAKEATDAYRDLAQFLIVRYMDGNKKKMDENGEFARNKYGKPLSPESPGYSKEFYEIIAKTTGDRYKFRSDNKQDNKR